MPNSRDPHAANSFRLLTLGGPALVDSTGAVVAEQRRRLALLALVASGRERGISRDKLIAALSPDSPADSARHSLHQLLYYLRQLIGDGGFLGTDPLRLNPAVVAFDAAEFEDALERGALEEAVALYRGPFLDGFHLAGSVEFEEWMANERARLAARHADALHRLARTAGDRGDHAGAAEWWRRLTVLDPLSSAAALGLMRALAAGGDRPAAVRHARIHEALVRAEVGAPADPDIAEYVSRLQREPPHEVPAPAAAGGPAQPVDEAPVTAGARPAAWRSRSTLLAAGFAGAALTSALAVLFGGRTPPRAASASPDRVAVLPFRLVSADTSLLWVRDGMAELLAIRLGGAGGVDVVDPVRTLATWHREGPDATRELSDEKRLRVAGLVGAGRAVDGTVIGDARRIVLHASLLEMPAARVVASAEADGPADSIITLIDRIAVRLLGTAAGVDQARLASLASPSFPAISEFLAGRAAFRRGNTAEAVKRFKEAVTLDSTFAIAGLELARASAWAPTTRDASLGMRAARRGRDRLNDADQALLMAMDGDLLDGPGMLARWDAAAAAYPDRPEMWYWLGDSYFHWGDLVGIPDARARAEVAFRRGWELDSAAAGAAAIASALVAEPMEHMIQLAHLRHDTAEVRQLVSRVIAADPESELSRRVRWHLAAVGDSVALREFWARPGQHALMEASLFMTWTGVDMKEFPRVAAEDRKQLAAHNEGYSQFALASYARNGGRPGDMPEGTEWLGTAPHQPVRNQVRDAIWWDGDTAEARRAAALLARAVAARPDSILAVRTRYMDLCTLGLWRAANGDMKAAGASERELRVARIPGLAGADSASARNASRLCAELLEAWRLTSLRLPGAHAALVEADSLARARIFEVCCGGGVVETNLLLARLWEALGDVPRARMAIRRRAGGFAIAPTLLSSFLREEGRLSTLAADTVSAIRAYRHYLALRFDPEPALRPEVERVRRELNALLATAGRRD